MSSFASLFLGGCVVLFSNAAVAMGDAAAGEALYESRCIACHSLDANRVGPMHRGVYGRKSGTVNGYDYSRSLKRAAIVWDEKSLDRWLTDPEKLVPGQKMNYQVPDAKDRENLIAFLKRESGI